MITVTLQDMVNSLNLINSLMNQSLKAKTAYKIARIAREIEKEYKLFDEARLKLINEYGKKDDDGQLIEENGNYIINPDNVVDYNNAADELLNTVIEINIEPIDVEELDGIELTPQQMIVLESYLK